MQQKTRGRFANCQDENTSPTLIGAIERVYFDFVYPSLSYESFDVVLNAISTGGTDWTAPPCQYTPAGTRWKFSTIDERSQQGNDNSQQRRRRLAGQSDKFLTIDYEIWCDSQKSGTFEDLTSAGTQAADRFMPFFAAAILKAFNDSTKASEEIEGEDVPIYTASTDTFVNPNIDNRTLLEKFLDDDLLLINLTFIGCAFIVCFAGWMHVKLKCKKPRALDTSHTRRFLVFALQIWDISSDVLFVRDSFTAAESGKEPKLQYTLVAIASLIFLLAPWVANMVSAFLTP